MLKVGTINYATEQGLGILVKSFYDAKIITDVMVVKHTARPSRMDWYPDGTPWTLARPLNHHAMREFCRSVDVMFFFETPFDWELVPYCKTMGIKTVLMPMYECMPEQWPYQPDLIINPSHLDQQYYPDGVHIPVPVDRDRVPYYQRSIAKVFVHNAGHGGLKGRNGTEQVLEAMKYVKSDLKLIIRSQNPITTFPQHIVTDKRVDLRIGTIPYEELWKAGDVFLFPEKFNGLSLPLQEARASGMLVMCGNRFPMNQWLPKEPLIPVLSYVRDRIGGCVPFDNALFSPQQIAEKMDEWYDRDISEYSRQGAVWAESMSWGVIKHMYTSVLNAL